MIDIITTVFLVGAGLYFLVVYCYQHVLKPKSCPGFSENKEENEYPRRMSDAIRFPDATDAWLAANVWTE